MAYPLLLFFLFSLVFLYSVSPAVCESIPTQWSIRVQNDDAPFGGRSQQGVEALPSGSLIVLGTGPSGELSNDCWKSTNDGQSWTRVGSAPWAPRRGHRTLLMDNDLWMFGGYNATSNTYFNDVWMTKDECNTWQKIGGSYPGVEGACTANIFGVALSTTGKFSSNNAPTSNSYISDDGSTWTLVADERVNGRQYRMWRLPGQTRFNAACTRLGSLVIVAGGTNSTGHQLSDIWAFDPSMEMWYKIRDLPVSRSGGIIIGKLPKLFLIGGKDLTDNKYKDDVWEWTLSSIENPANQSPWIKSFDSLAFGGLTSAAAVYNSVSQKLIVVGGMNQAGPSSKVYQLSFEDVPQCAGLSINNYE